MHAYITGLSRSAHSSIKIIFFGALFLHAAPAINGQAKAISTDPCRVNACYSASRTEIAESLCLYYNHRFSYYLSYGAVDQHAEGSYHCSNDTIYLDSKPARSFIITANKTAGLPKGKIKLLFKSVGRNASFITWSTQTGGVNDVESMTKAGTAYYKIIDRPADDQLSITHALYDKESMPYALAKDKNEFVVSISDSLGTVFFNQKPLVWEGDNLRVADAAEPRLFAAVSAAAPGYEEIHWNTAEPKPSPAEFNEWSEKQEALRRIRRDRQEALQAEIKVQQQKEMMRHLQTVWNTALAEARRDTVSLVAILGADSIAADNSSDGFSADTLQQAPAKKSLAQDYYEALQPQPGDELLKKTPVFYQALQPQDSLLRKFNIDNLPAVLVLSAAGDLQFKSEGIVVKKEKLRDYFTALAEQAAKSFTDSVLKVFTTGTKDSASIVSMINLLEKSNSEWGTALADSGITVKNLLDTLVGQQLQHGYRYNRVMYDFVATKYFKEDPYKNFSMADSLQPIGPVVSYLAEGFSRRQQDSSLVNPALNDSLLMNVYHNLVASINIGSYLSKTQPALYEAWLELHKKLINGHKRYVDFFGSVSYLAQKLELLQSKRTSAGNYENDLVAFFKTYAGGWPFSATAADAAASQLYKEMMQDKNGYFLKIYFPSVMDEAKCTSIFRAVNGHMLTLMATARMSAFADTAISAALLKKSNALPLLQQAAALANNAEGYWMKRNYAYALYETGDGPGAVRLLNEVMTAMKDNSNRYLVTDDRKKIVAANLAKIKAGKAIHWKAFELAAY